MGFKNLFTFLLLLIGVYEFSEAHYPDLAQRTKRFGSLQDPRNHGQFYLPDYFHQNQHLKHFSHPEQSSNADLLRNLNYRGYNQQLNPAFPGEHQQLNYHDMINYPNQFHQLTHPGQIQQHNLQSELDRFRDFNNPPFHNSDSEHHQIDYRGNINYPDQYQQHNYFNHDHQLNQNGQPEQLRYLNQLQLQPHNPIGEHQHPDYHAHQQVGNHDMLSYSNQPQHLHAFHQDQLFNQQGEHENHNELEVHKSSGAHQQIDNHDMSNYSNQPLPLSTFHQDQLLNQQDEHEKIGNLNNSHFHNSDGETHQINNEFQQHNQENEHNPLNEMELHKSTGEHQQLDNHDMPNSNQPQHLNTSHQDQLLNQEDEHENFGNLNHSHFHNPDGETHQINDQFQQPSSFEVGQLNQQSDLKEPVNLNQPKIDNSIEEHPQINYRSMLDHPIPLQELNHFSQDQHLNQQSKSGQPMNLNQAQPHNPSGDHQQGNGNEVPVVQQQNGPPKFLNYNQQQDYPHQPVDLGHLHQNQKYGYPDNLLQLSNVGLHQQFDPKSVHQEFLPLNEPQLPRYARENMPPFYRSYLPYPAPRPFHHPGSHQRFPGHPL